jgi:hypothetical protein
LNQDNEKYMNSFPIENITSAAQTTDSWPKVCITHVGILKALMLGGGQMTIQEISDICGSPMQCVQKDITYLPGALSEHAPGWKLNRKGDRKTKGFKGYVYALEGAKR